MAPQRERAPARQPLLDDEHLALMAALRRLPLPQREAIALYYLADLPVTEVAACLGVPVGTVKTRLSRALVHDDRARRPHHRPDGPDSSRAFAALDRSPAPRARRPHQPRFLPQLSHDMSKGLTVILLTTTRTLLGCSTSTRS